MINSDGQKLYNIPDLKSVIFSDFVPRLRTLYRYMAPPISPNATSLSHACQYRKVLNANTLPSTHTHIYITLLSPSISFVFHMPPTQGLNAKTLPSWSVFYFTLPPPNSPKNPISIWVTLTGNFRLIITKSF